MILETHLHPMLVHFPIALIIVSFLADLISLIFKKEPCFSRTGYYLMITGMFSALLAWGTGHFFTQQMEGEAGLIRSQHELFATFTLVSVIVATIARIILEYQKTGNTPWRFIPFALSAISVIFITITGFLGGKLVIDYMIGL